MLNFWNKYKKIIIAAAVLIVFAYIANAYVGGNVSAPIVNQ